MSASKPAVPEPTEIDGRYQVEKKLGAGAFGTVYKARDKELGRLVAIKTIRLEGLAASSASMDDLLKRFKQEAKVAANLRHPNIVALWDWKNTEGFAYISMEFVDGVGLDRVIAKSGRMSVERAAAIGAQVADALDYAWRHQKLVHRDIKPANIMIEPGDHVKVTDFGIAKWTDSAEHLTVTGSLLGTPSYMSPEQARGQAIDGRSDLFSLGCILYEMVGGQKAFRGESITALLFKIITEEPPSLRELDPTVSDEMLRIIAKALSKAPETRYPSGRELADDLLAVTRPGFVPTLHAADVPTLPPDAPPRDVPTIASPPTVRPAPTIGSAATAGRQAATSPGPPAPGTPPPLPPTILTPPTARAGAAPLPPKPVVRPPQPAAGPPATRKGGGAGLLVGLGLVAVLGLAAVVGGGWYLFGRKAGTTEPSPAPEQARTTATPAPAEAASPEPGAAAHAELMPSPGPATATTSGTIAQPSPTPRVASRTATTTMPAAASRPPEAGAAGTPPAGDYAFLDEPPSEAPDGRATGEALAQKYRTGGSGSYSSTRFSPRPRWPRGLTRPEGPAVRVLLHIHSAEEAYHRKTGRYGNLREMADADVFGLDVPFRADGFQRTRYAFHVTTQADGYRVEATPLAPIGRAFVVDDSGFVQLRDE